jgi:tetratricopeptide (TPR) repeat protein
MSTNNPELRLLEEYRDDLQAIVDEKVTSEREDREIQKRFDAKLAIYQKQISTAQAIDPEAAVVHQSNSYYLKARRTWDASIIGNRFKGNSKKALTILDEGLAVYDSGRIHFLKAQILDALGRKQDAVAELKHITATMQNSEEIYISARKYLADLENPPKKGPCFVATACYGSYDHPDVQVLRRWRDQSLTRSAVGCAFVRFYYEVGPVLASLVDHRPWAKKCVTIFAIEPLVRLLRRSGFGN